MALSRELKAYINRKYDDRITVLNNKKSEAMTKARTDFDTTNREGAITLTEDTAQALKDMMELLEEKGFPISYDGKDFIKRGIFNLVNLPQFQDKSKITKIYESQIAEINTEREKLLIILSLEKNFDTINALLKEYNLSF